jgi:aspartate/methionine/tyrosine aminotransferase
MHGDRIGYIVANAEMITMAARVQVNTNSFASTYGQVAAHIAMQPEYDSIATSRAQSARGVLLATVSRLRELPQLKVVVPEGGYFLFVDFSDYAEYYEGLGYDSACDFLLDKARVASIDGKHFCGEDPAMQHWVRLNCGRSAEVLQEACDRITAALCPPRS